MLPAIFALPFHPQGINWANIGALSNNPYYAWISREGIDGLP